MESGFVSDKPFGGCHARNRRTVKSRSQPSPLPCKPYGAPLFRPFDSCFHYCSIHLNRRTPQLSVMVSCNQCVECGSAARSVFVQNDNHFQITRCLLYIMIKYFSSCREGIG